MTDPRTEKNDPEWAAAQAAHAQAQRDLKVARARGEYCGWTGHSSRLYREAQQAEKAARQRLRAIRRASRKPTDAASDQASDQRAPYAALALLH